uniref:Uncharacterized protein n=1 Tax=Oryza glumipatula TaxID=40148 RepID=A0A0E0A475_9ORYZ
MDIKLASPFISQLLNNSSLSSLKPWDRFLNPIISMLGAAAATPIEFSIIAFRNISSLSGLGFSSKTPPRLASSSPTLARRHLASASSSASAAASSPPKVR